jgi:hypothetical protein
MTLSEFKESVVEPRIELIREVLVKKGTEYGADKSTFHTFEQASELSYHKSPQGVAWEFMCKHLQSIRDMISDKEFDDRLPSKEMVKEKFGDAINYLILMEGMFKEDIEESEKVTEVYNHLKKLMMEQFMEILNQNADIFNEDSIIRTDFLPQIEFKHLWNCELSDKTREMIWKYLQLILITIIHINSNCEENMDSVLKQMDTEEIRTKLNDAVENMKNLFQNTEKNNMNNFQSQMDTLLNGKLGNLAKEMAQDTFKDLEIDAENPLKMWDTLFKDSSQLNNLIKNIGEKLNNKMETGEVNEQDLLKESVNLFSQMKNIPGLNNFTDILNNMGNIPGVNKKKMDVKSAYDSIILFKKTSTEIFPLIVNQKVFEIIN